MTSKGRLEEFGKSPSERNEIGRPTPPMALPEPVKKTWRSIVESLPANWFAPSDVPLLQTYCYTTAIFVPQIDALIEAAGVTSRELRTRNALMTQATRLADRLRIRAFHRTGRGSRKAALTTNRDCTLGTLLSLRDCDV